MAKIPLEIIDYTSDFTEEIKTSIGIANSLQDAIEISLIPNEKFSNLNLNEFEDVDGDFVMKNLINTRNRKKGFHPFLLAITDKYLYNEECYNLFGTNDEYEGVGIFTTYNVPDEIIPKDKIIAYFLYYFTRYTISYSSPKNENHEETKGCLYDTKMNKLDILKSMKDGSLCEDCRVVMFESEYSLVNEEILESANKILKKCNEILESVNLDWNPLIDKKNKLSKERVIELIGNSKIIKAIEAIEFEMEITEDENTNLLLFKSQYNRSKGDYLKGLLSHTDFGIEQNRITMGIIELINGKN